MVRSGMAGRFRPFRRQGLRRGRALAPEDADSLCRRCDESFAGHSRGRAENYFRRARRVHRRRTRAPLRRCRLRRGIQLQRPAHAGRRPAGDSRSQQRTHQAHRPASLAQEIRRLRRHQSQLFGHRACPRSRAAAPKIWPRHRDGRHHAGRQRRGISRCRLARHPGQCDSFYPQRRRKNGGGNQEAARRDERLQNNSRRIRHERAMQSRRS